MLNYNELFDLIETCPDWLDFLDNPIMIVLTLGYEISNPS